MKQPILIDTDPGQDVDDILAIAFALLRPELDIKAITTVTPGSIQRALLVNRLLKSVGREEIPVAAGAELPGRPLSPELRVDYTDKAHGLNHAGFCSDDDESELAGFDAASLIIGTVERYPGEIGIVGIGPMTNLAAALGRRPEIAGKIKFIALMGGEIDLFRIEHNIAWDYHAAAVVFAAGVPIFLGTWSITRQFTLLPDDCARIKRHGSPLTDLLSQCIDLWWPYKGDKAGPVMYDIAPIIWSFDRSHYRTEPMVIAVETRGKLTSGMTLRVQGPSNADVTVGVDVDAVKKLYLDTILGESASA